MTKLSKEQQAALKQDIAANLPADELKKKYSIDGSQLYHYMNPEEESARMKAYRTTPTHVEYLRRKKESDFADVFESFSRNIFVRRYRRKVFEESLRLKTNGNRYYNKHIIAIATYYVFRKNNNPCTLDEVADSFGLPPRIFKRAFKNCYSEEKLLPITVAAFIKQYAKKSKIPEDVEARALELDKKYSDIFAGRTPHHIAQYWICYARRELSDDGKLANRSFIRQWADVCFATINQMDKQLEERLKT